LVIFQNLHTPVGELRRNEDDLQRIQ
jgi:hypothetical protein